MQFPTSNDEKYLWKIDMSYIELLDLFSIYQNLFYQILWYFSLN